jgi:hypothetical protein
MVNLVLHELPFGKGRPWLNGGGLTDILFGGRELGSLFNVQTGFPLMVFSGRDQSNTGAGFDRPNVVAGQSGNQLREERTARRWFNTAAFVSQPFGTFGNTGRNTIISPGIVQWDASLLKSFRFSESKRLQFRFEAFNAAHHPNLGNPDTTVTSTNFGRITSTRLNMRELQFGLKRRSVAPDLWSGATDHRKNSSVGRPTLSVEPSYIEKSWPRAQSSPLRFA